MKEGALERVSPCKNKPLSSKFTSLNNKILQISERFKILMEETINSKNFTDLIPCGLVKV
jgi:hypothetical protein